jgi:hypothetical protein
MYINEKISDELKINKQALQKVAEESFYKRSGYFREYQENDYEILEDYQIENIDLNRKNIQYDIEKYLELSNQKLVDK